VELATSFHIVTEPVRPLQLPVTPDNVSGAWEPRGDTKAVTSTTATATAPSSSPPPSTSTDSKATFELALSLGLHQIVVGT
jgi:hypothetical protein